MSLILKKSNSNKEKHGIDFEEAQDLWKDEDLTIIDARDENEKRYMVIGKVDSKFWSGVFTLRDGKIRVISARRSRRKEIELYEKERRIRKRDR